jgi:beta-glucosidase/6-phospho-beta-glucosidase/beta-galactosidase
MEVIATPTDFLGINYYSNRFARARQRQMWTVWALAVEGR